MTVDVTYDPFVFEKDLTGYGLIVIGWTQAHTTENLTARQETSLLHAVEQGTGVAGDAGQDASYRPPRSSPAALRLCAARTTG